MCSGSGRGVHTIGGKTNSFDLKKKKNVDRDTRDRGRDIATLVGPVKTSIGTFTRFGGTTRTNNATQ